MVRQINTSNWNDFVSAFPQVESRLIGFDRVFDAVNRIPMPDAKYPPYNLKKLNDDEYEIQLALAGYQKTELSVIVEDGKLVVKGEQDSANVEYLHKGIAERNFTRTWSLTDTVKVTGSELKDGILTIKLVNEIPEEKKPQEIKIK